MNKTARRYCRLCWDVMLDDSALMAQFLESVMGRG